MKKLVLLGLFIMCLSQTAHAILPASQGNVQSAQMFGMGQKDSSTESLLAGWTIYDNKKQNPYGNKEHIIIYTPYLATAVDAQNTAKKGEKSNVQHGLDLAKQYDGILAIGVVLNTTFKAEPKLLKIQLLAGGKTYLPYYTSLEKATETTVRIPKKVLAGGGNTTGISAQEKAKLYQVQKEVAARNKAVLKGEKAQPKQPIVSNKPQPSDVQPVKVWNLEYFTYFDLAGLATAQPMVLSITDQVGGERRFNLHLINIK